MPDTVRALVAGRTSPSPALDGDLRVITMGYLRTPQDPGDFRELNAEVETAASEIDFAGDYLEDHGAIVGAREECEKLGKPVRALLDELRSYEKKIAAAAAEGDHVSVLDLEQAREAGLRTHHDAIANVKALIPRRFADAAMAWHNDVLSRLAARIRISDTFIEPHPIAAAAFDGLTPDEARRVEPLLPGCVNDSEGRSGYDPRKIVDTLGAGLTQTRGIQDLIALLTSPEVCGAIARDMGMPGGFDRLTVPPSPDGRVSREVIDNVNAGHFAEVHFEGSDIDLSRLGLSTDEPGRLADAHLHSEGPAAVILPPGATFHVHYTGGPWDIRSAGAT
ncbi:hypothetical protein [Ramlibacter sp.]|uniref:hypothetical protein n=1 Tax=Ramlibacter sp. TaxID=1917967 RepID=UPI003D14B89B